jgi:long-chain fatty acid transport protein
MRSTHRGGLIAVHIAGIIGTVALASSAQASGYLTARYGSDHGTPAAPNPYAVYYNPAALGGMKGTQIVADVGIAIRSASYERTQQALTPSGAAVGSDPTYQKANTGKATLTNVLPLPYLGAASDLGTKNLRLGYAFYIPFGGMAKWDRRSEFAGSADAPGAVDGPQRWHNISGQILAIYNTAAVAYRFDNFSIGANVSVVYHHAETVRARTVDSSDDIRTPNGALKEGRSYLNVSGLNFAASLGVYWQPTDAVKLGLSYTSQPGFGTTRMKGTLENQFGSDPNRAASTPVDLLQTYPDIIRFGAAFRVSKLAEIRFDGDFVRWNVFDKQCLVQRGATCELDAQGNQTNGKVVLNIPRNWQNAWGARLGGALFPTEALEIFGSVSVTTSAVPKSTIDASTIDSTRLYLALGGRYELSSSFALAASYNPIYFFPVNTNGASQHDNFGSTSRSPSADGKYSSIIHIINVNATVSF